MGLAPIIAEIVGYVTPLYSGLVSKTGKELLAEHDVPPRLVWIPTSDSFGPAKLQNVEPRPIRTRIAGVAVHIWGADLATTEQMVNDVIGAIHKTAYGNYEIRSGTWLEPAKDQKGRAYVLEFTVEIPVCLPAQTTAIAVSIPQTVGIQLVGPGQALAEGLASGFGGGSFVTESTGF